MRVRSDETEFGVVDEAVSDELAHTALVQFTNCVLEELSTDATMPVFRPYLNGEFRRRSRCIDKCMRGPDGFAIVNSNKSEHIGIVTNERLYLGLAYSTYRVEEPQIPIPVAQAYEKLAINVGVGWYHRSDNHAAMLAASAEEPAKIALELGRT